MKKNRVLGLAGMVSLALAFAFVLAVGMAFVSCDNSTNGDTDSFEGTWIGTGERQGATMVAANGSYTETFNGTEIIRGTYSVTGNTVTMTMVQLNTIVFGSADKWFSWADLDASYKAMLLNSDTFQVTIQGDSILDDEGVAGFTRQK
jgi:hypothetical protein